mmetsp:Transcript_4593/g.17301  ORF Transcript_4593/g.17301 Transcript_4593/m.17301 type:complete len:165 (-) Transcript_4593:37-531(-)
MLKEEMAQKAQKQRKTWTEVMSERETLTWPLMVTMESVQNVQEPRSRHGMVPGDRCEVVERLESDVNVKIPEASGSGSREAVLEVDEKQASGSLARCCEEKTARARRRTLWSTSGDVDPKRRWREKNLKEAGARRHELREESGRRAAAKGAGSCQSRSRCLHLP